MKQQVNEESAKLRSSQNGGKLREPKDLSNKHKSTSTKKIDDKQPQNTVGNIVYSPRNKSKPSDVIRKYDRPDRIRKVIKINSRNDGNILI